VLTARAGGAEGIDAQIAGLMSGISASGSSGITATVQAEVWIRPCDSVAGTRCTRWPPDSNFRRPYTPSPLILAITSLNRHVRLRWRS
jgi:hypothetical protein